MASDIVQRIERELRMPGLAEALGKLAASDLRSLLMDVYRERAVPVTEAGIAAQAARDPLMAPSAVDARDLAAFDTAAFAAAGDFDALELSPVCPFSAASALGGTSQNNVLTSIRNAEVLGDPTIALALEASRRRRSEELVRLCASQRVIRLQPFDVPGFSPHFRLFALVSAGRDSGSSRFEIAQLREHVGVHLRLFRSLRRKGFAIESPLVEFTDLAGVEAALANAGISREEVRKIIRAHKPGGSEQFLREHGVTQAATATHSLLDDEVILPLSEEFPEAQYRINQERLEGLGYYQKLAMRITLSASDGNRYPVVDGGFTDWSARLMENRKERLLISGIGSEFVCKMFRNGAAD